MQIEIVERKPENRSMCVRRVADTHESTFNEEEKINPQVKRQNLSSILHQNLIKLFSFVMQNTFSVIARLK